MEPARGATVVQKYAMSGPADTTFARAARLAISSIASGFGADVEEVDDVRLVISELFNVATENNAESIELIVEASEGSLRFYAMASGVSHDVATPISIRIFEALVTQFKSEFTDDGLTLSGELEFTG